MKRTIYFLLLWLFISSTNFEAQPSPDIAGEINTRLNFDLDNSEEIWSRTTFRLKLDSHVNDNACAYTNLKMFTTETSQFGWKLSEAYVDYYVNKFDLRVGVQQISWGTGYSINPTNNINPFDLSEQEAFIPEERLGVTAMRIKYYPVTNLALTGILIPYFVPALEVPGVSLPEKTLKNSEYALKLAAQSIMGCDFSASYFKGKEDYPWINGQYRDLEVFGGDVIGTIREMALWAEGALTKPDTGDSYYQIAAGGEYTFGSDLYSMVQVFHRNFPGVKENYLMAALRYPFLDIHTLQSGMAYETENNIFIVYPELTLSLADATSLKIGGMYITEQEKGSLLNQIKNMLFLELTYCF
ncbi:hypothetical protein KAU34_02130 [candidate division WOR-3 bacterium]|nr:hypothetical protein [candidate division WOR-3 bacterium]